MGEVLHEVDFNQLKIENQQYLEKIDERNQDLLRLKLMAGSTLQVLNKFKVYIIAPDKRGYLHNIFLISPWKHTLLYSLEVPWQGTSIEYPQDMFSWINNENINTLGWKKIPYLEVWYNFFLLELELLFLNLEVILLNIDIASPAEKSTDNLGQLPECAL